MHSEIVSPPLPEEGSSEEGGPVGLQRSTQLYLGDLPYQVASLCCLWGQFSIFRKPAVVTRELVPHFLDATTHSTELPLPSPGSGGFIISLLHANSSK